MSSTDHSILAKGEIIKINYVENGVAHATLKILPDDFIILACPKKVGQLVEGEIDTRAIPIKIGRVIPQEIILGIKDFQFNQL